MPGWGSRLQPMEPRSSLPSKKRAMGTTSGSGWAASSAFSFLHFASSIVAPSPAELVTTPTGAPAAPEACPVARPRQRSAALLLVLLHVLEPHADLLQFRQVLRLRVVR